MKITDNKFVSLSYDLNVGEGDERELMEKATAENPLTFLYGMGMMLEAFEKNLVGMQKGDKFSFTLSPDEAYGMFDEEHIVELPKNIFEIDGKFDSETIAEGQTVPMMDANGNRLNGSVVEVKEDVVIMDFNHPLAGETLHFEGEITDVREPSAEEIAALTSGGCGCGSNCGDECGEECDSSNSAKGGQGGCGCGCGCS